MSSSVCIIIYFIKQKYVIVLKQKLLEQPVFDIFYLHHCIVIIVFD